MEELKNFYKIIDEICKENNIKQKLLSYGWIRELKKDDKVIVIMDVNPVVDGHVLVIPKEHRTDFTELTQDEVTHIYGVTNK